MCDFYLDAFNFDTVQQVSWVISQQPPTGRAQVSSGTLTLADGTGHTTDMRLPAGHYKLTWNFAGEKGKAKSKVFWSTCAPTPPPTPTPSQSVVTSPSPSPSQSMVTSPSPSPSHCPCHSPTPSPTTSSESASATPSAGGSTAVSPSTGASGGPGGGNLAETGSPLLPLAGGTGLLVAVGTLLSRRSRKSAHTR